MQFCIKILSIFMHNLFNMEWFLSFISTNFDGNNTNKKSHNYIWILCQYNKKQFWKTSQKTRNMHWEENFAKKKIIKNSYQGF